VLPAVRQLGKLASNPLVQRLIGVLNAYHKKYGAQESEAFGYYACIVLQNGAAGTDTWKIDPEPYGTPNSGPASVDGNGGGARPAPRGAKDSKAAQAGSRKAPSSPKPKKGRNR
jgi:hypothetical protein